MWLKTSVKSVVWVGKAYRVDTGYQHDPGTTAADVIRYELSLGNPVESYVSGDMLEKLEQFPASYVIWVTHNREDAERYAEDGSEITEIALTGTIVGEDGDGGYLVFKGQL